MVPEVSAAIRPLGARLAFVVALVAVSLMPTPDVDLTPSASPGARTFIQSDKPIYRVGETVRLTAFHLDASTRVPVSGVRPARLVIKSPKGDPVAQLGASISNGCGGAEWTIPEGVAGGEYTAVASFPSIGCPPAELKFDVRAYRVPRLRTDLEFERKGYGAGETVAASLTVTRAQGGIPAGAKVTIVARVDGGEIHRSETRLDGLGRGHVEFVLPSKVETGDGSLACVIEDGGVQETAAKTIPIVLNKVDVAIHPEGGDLVAGVENHVYFEARDVRGKPVDLSGRVLDPSGSQVATFEVGHEGRGRFGFVPAAGTRYRLAIDKPVGNTQVIELPEVLPRGFTLHAARRVIGPTEPLRLSIGATSDESVSVVVARFAKEIKRESAAAQAGTSVTRDIEIAPEFDGILRVTVLDSKGTPRAERLIYRKPARAVIVAVKPSTTRGVPGQKVTVDVTTTDQDGKPVPALVGLRVTDDAVLNQIERRERAPRLPAQALIGSDVKELMDSERFFETGPAADVAIDLLLGTQGWRRFAWVDVGAFVARHGDAARRAFAVVEEPEVTKFGRLAGGGGPGAAMVDAVVEELRMGAGPRDGAARLGAAPAGKAAAPKNEPKFEAPAGEARDALLGDDDRARALDIGEFKKRVVVREYAHASRPDRRTSERTDFTEVLYWNCGVSTDATGRAAVSFDLSDSITSFRVMADAVGKDGALGSADAVIESRKPFFVEPKLPLVVTAGDVLEIPVAINNATDAAMAATLTADAGAGVTKEGNDPEIQVPANGSARGRLTLVAGKLNGWVDVVVRAQSGVLTDEVKRRIRVVPAGFPVMVAFGGRLTQRIAHDLVIPDQLDASSLVAEARIYPSPLATLTDALKGLLTEPCGCFEQTSSTAYPNVLVMEYLSTHHVDDGATLARAKQLLDSGYKRLTGYECKERGYEWFGGNPGHEALTAYGVMEFVDMSRVYGVDRSMLERTRSWLRDRRDGKGGFTRNPQALDSFGGAPDDITNAYIVWALLEAGERGLEKEIEWVAARAKESDDAYFLALAANVMYLGKHPQAPAILDRLNGKQGTDGAVRGATTSITRSSGTSLEVETTSLAIMAWLRAGGHMPSCDRAAIWLFQQCQGGRFGATQSTILALKAILGYDAANARPKAPGKVTLLVDGKAIGTVPFTTDDKGALEMPAFTNTLTAGNHRIELAMDGGSEMPYAITVRYHTQKPPSAGDCKVKLATKLASPSVRQGETTDLEVTFSNATAEGQPMAVAIVGIPGGLEPRHDQLKELVKAGLADFYEVRDGDVVFYKRCLKPSEVVNIRLNLVAAVAGTYVGAASRAYLYYSDEAKSWCDGVRVAVKGD